MGQRHQDREHQSGARALSSALKVLSGNGPRAAVRELCQQFERATGHAVALRFEVNPDVVRKAQAGEPFDVAVGNPHTIDQLIACGKAVAGSRVDFGRSGLAAAVKSGAPKPDITTADAFKRSLLALNAVAFPGEGASGVYFVGLLERMGIAAQMHGKLKPMKAEDCVEVVARGEADMVVVVATRMMGVAGVDVVGPLPEELQTKIGFSAGLSASTKEPDAALALIQFLSAPSAAPTLRKNGVEPC
ncbi:MAG: substrate-binding domain-containing protein [Alphaproteobacteria bacterium]|nr:substrate-binding domain-containing protein [Alphaproteobacteria bacterium]